MRTMLLFGLFVFSSALHADVRLPAFFSDYMVLQQEKPVPVWGWADPEEEVSVAFGDQKKTAKAGADGKWLLKLDPLKASSSPQSMTVSTLKNSKSPILQIKNILVGEVWLCSGQSNMKMTLRQCGDSAKEAAASNYPNLRMFTVAENAQPSPQDNCGGTWMVCTPDNASRFSAAAFYFGLEIHQNLDVPVGLINSSWGGTTVEAWTSLKAQSKLEEYKIISKEATQMLAQPWDEKREMAKYEKQLADWTVAADKAKTENKAVPSRPRKPADPRFDKNIPANLYNGMINPLVPYAIRGAIWYQGELNAYKGYANLYGLQLATLISDWRTRWGYEFPFAWVQLPEYEASWTRWVVIREEMLKSLSIPNTGMAVGLGLGEAKNIHPKAKQDIGKRLALWALAKVYDKKNIVYSGPLPEKHAVRGAEVIISFKHTDGGLFSKDGVLKGFTISGEDQKWVKATAKIEGNTVIVSSPSVPKPVAVRHAWEANPEWSLINGAGLPATPFRTDSWEPYVAQDKNTQRDRNAEEQP